MNLKNSKLFIFIAVCLVATASALLLLCGCGEQNAESVPDVSVNAEASDSENDASIDVESNDSSEPEASDNDESVVDESSSNESDTSTDSTPDENSKTEETSTAPDADESLPQNDNNTSMDDNDTSVDDNDNSSDDTSNDTSEPEESTEIPPADLDDIFNDALDLLDLYYNFDAEYIVSELIRQGAGQSHDRISAEEFEGLMYKLFYVDDELLQEVRDYSNYNPDDQTYELTYDNWGGGVTKTREYHYYVKNGDTYNVYFSHINYEHLIDMFPDSDSYYEFVYEYEMSGNYGDPIEYNGVLWEYEWGDFYRIAGYSDYGRKYTVEYNDGIVRLLSCEEYDNRVS